MGDDELVTYLLEIEHKAFDPQDVLTSCIEDENVSLMQFAIDHGGYMDKELFDYAIESNALKAAKFILDVLGDSSVCDEQSLIRVRLACNSNWFCLCNYI